VKRALVVVTLASVAASLGCGDAPILATFTSTVVQHETCNVVGDRPEVCTREESSIDLRVRVVEREDDIVWLYGVDRGGASDRAILGTRDADGGFLFIDDLVQENDVSDCTLAQHREISLTIDPEAKADDVGTNPCVALVGRDVETTSASAGCDEINEPPTTSTVIARRRWQAPAECEP
jgi:hypothetical protein